MNTSKICAEIAAERNAHEVTLFGELIGVQDLSYGTPKGELAYLAFDLRVDGEYLSYDEFLPLMERFEVPTVPIAYRGPFDYEKIKALSEGQSMIAEHVREGVVIRPSTERRDNELGRVILKSVGEGYLTRKGETTEYE
jgi:RNA ligase (TIGR02306 family)